MSFPQQHAHHGHAHGHAHGQQQQPQQGMQGQPNQIHMQVVQTPDGGWGLIPYMPPAQQAPQGVGQAVAPQPNWLGLALVLGGTGVALWWAYRKWVKDDGTRREREPERIYESHRRERSYGHERGSLRGYEPEERGRERHRSYERYRGSEERVRSGERVARPDERRTRRSKTRLLAEYKRYLDTQERERGE